jgi:putative transposase
MSGVLNLEIAESREHLKSLLNQQKTAQGKERVQALYLLKIGQVKTVQDLALALGRNRVTLQRWLQKYRSEGLDGLLSVKKSQGRKPAIPKEVMIRLQHRLQESPPFKSYGEVQTWLKQEFGIEASYKVVHEAVRYRLKYNLKRAKSKTPKKAARP